MAVSFQRLAAVFLGGLLGAAGAFLLCGKSTFPTGGEPTEGIPVPGIMYHNVLPDGSEGLGEYVVSASELEGDLQLLKEAGYEGVTPEELFDFVRGVGTLPEKPVLLTFDDGFESMEQVVLPLLQKYSFKATAAIVGEYTDLYSGDVPKALSYSHLSWEQCRELADSGLVEIANHTYGFHHLEDGRKGLRKKKGESEETYRKVLSDDLLLLQERCRDHLGKEPRALVYPYGFYSGESETLAESFGFSVTVTCEEGVNFISNRKSLKKLKRYNRPHGADPDEFFKKAGIVGSP